ncbi:MAG: DUF4270 family protein [Bacteroidota bacterium]|nr:DUF4270 family protein [Bacteroidota bacterium]
MIINNNSRQNSHWYSLLLFLLIISFSSCNKGDNLIGKDILPPGDEILLSFNQGVTIESFTVSVDSVISDENEFSSSRPHCLLGSYIDPVFGLSKASFLTQVRLSKNQINFGDDFYIDSVVLYLNLTNIYGEERQSGPQEIFIYQLTDSINKDSSYASNIDVSGYIDEASILAHFNYVPAYMDTVLAIPLDIDAFEFLKDTNNLIDNSTFHEAFMGLYLTSTTVDYQGSILSFNMLSEKSKLTLHYHNYPGSSPLIPASAHSELDFLINEKCARINLFEHDYSLAQNPIQFINAHNIDDTLIYVQAMGGLKAKIKIPDLGSYFDSENIVINQARLFFPVLENSTGDFSPPTSLNLRHINDNGGDENMPDLYHNGTLYGEYFNGSYNDDIKGYEFNIAQYIQELIDGEKPNYGFYITPYSPSDVTMPNRVILKGGSANNGIKLYITYIKL